MAGHIHVHLLLILMIWFGPLVLSLAMLSTEKLSKSGFRVNMVHRDSLDANVNNNMTFAQRVARAVERSMIRQRQIQNIITRKDTQTTVRPESGDYLIKVAVGTPPVTIEAMMDTASDTVWTECQLCDECLKEPKPVYDASHSTTFSKVLCDDPLCQALEVKSCGPDCDYVQSYADGSESEGILSYETWRIGDGLLHGTEFAHIAFGCGTNNVGFDDVRGVVGMGRGPLSLISQIGPHVQSKFSYCLLSIEDESQTSPLYFGESANLGAEARVVPYAYTEVDRTFYYVPLEGISVDDSLLAIPEGTFEVHPDGSGGVILDSGSMLTVLPTAAYNAVKQAFQSIIHLPTVESPLPPLELCFNGASTGGELTLPSLTLHFHGGARWDIPSRNSFLYVDDGADIFCLGITSESAGAPSMGFSVIGSLFQHDFHISFDNEKNTLSFLPAHCASA